MNEQDIGAVSPPWFKSRQLMLIVAILVLILVAPFLKGYVQLRLLLDISFSVVFITAVFTVSRKKKFLVLGIVLALPMIISLWSKYFLVSDSVVIWGRIFGIVFFGFAVVHMAQFIYRAQEVTKEVVFSAVAVYLILALMWTFIYTVLELLEPGSFNIPDNKIRESSQIFLYFSFVTITTLGYGDITPLTEKATSLAILEALIGQIYLVVVIAWLVGMFVSRKSRQ